MDSQRSSSVHARPLFLALFERNAAGVQHVLRQASPALLLQPGRWTLQLSPAGGASQLSSPVTLAVTSRPRAHEAPPVRLWARPSAPWVVYPAVASLHARLSKGPDVVLDASVWASVGRPRGRHVVITLHDDGLGRSPRGRSQTGASEESDTPLSAE